jgi:hypothetical protein
MLWCYYHECSPFECGGPHGLDGQLVELYQPKAPRGKVKPKRNLCVECYGEDCEPGHSVCPTCRAHRSAQG